MSRSSPCSFAALVVFALASSIAPGQQAGAEPPLKAVVIEDKAKFLEQILVEVTETPGKPLSKFFQKGDKVKVAMNRRTRIELVVGAKRKPCLIWQLTKGSHLEIRDIGKVLQSDPPQISPGEVLIISPMTYAFEIHFAPKNPGDPPIYTTRPRDWEGELIATIGLGSGTKATYSAHDIPGGASKDEQDAAVKAIEKLGGKVVRDAKVPGMPVVEVDLGAFDVNDDDLVVLKPLKHLRKLALGSGINGGGLKEIKDLKNLQELNLTFTAVGDDALKHLKELKHLKTLTLGQTLVTDAGLKELGELKDMEELDLDGTAVTDVGMKAIAGMPRLKRLILGGTKITNAGLKEINVLKNLVVLDLDHTKMSDDGLMEIKKFTELQVLFLNGAKITDRGLKELGGLKIHWLGLKDTAVTSDGMKHVKELKELEKLNLQGTQVDDASLRELHGLKKLRWLNIHGINGTVAGVAELKKALPDLQIE